MLEIIEAMHRSAFNRTDPGGPAVLLNRRVLRGVGRGIGCSWVVWLWFLLALGLCLSPAAHAQGRRNPNWTNFDTELVASPVRAVLIDQDGSVWFGTTGGLSHFSGFWESYTQEDGLPAGSVTALAQSSDGTIWVGTESGLSRSPRPSAGAAREWLPVEIDDLRPPVRALWAARTGELWVGSAGGAGYLRDNTWHAVVPAEKNVGPVSIQAIVGNGKDKVWLGGDQLFIYDLARSRLDVMSGFPATASVQTLLVAGPRGSWPELLWVGTAGDGLWSYDGLQWSSFYRPPGTPATETIASNDVLALAQDSRGTLWIGTNPQPGFVGGISIFNPSGLGAQWGDGFWRNLTTVDGLSANAVSAIAIDDDDVVWIGTVGGADRYDSRSWQTLAGAELPTDLGVTTAWLDSTGVLWLGTEGAGLVRYDGHTVQRLTEEAGQLPENYVRALVEDDDGYLWIGTARQGLFRAPLIGVSDLTQVDPASWQHFAKDVLGSNVLRAAARASDGSLWFGTLAGVAHFLPDRNGGGTIGSWERFSVQDGLGAEQVSHNALIVDGHDRVWVGTPAGVSRYDPTSGHWRTYTTADGLSNNRVLSLAATPPGAEQELIWAGTADGTVSQYNASTDRWTTFASQTGPVFALLATADHELWIGTAGGVRRHDLSNGLWSAYSQADGLVANEIRVFLQDQDGTIWIGTSAGISGYRPSSKRPVVRILSVNGHKPIKGHVEVLAGEPVAIAYLGGDLVTSSERLGYRGRLSRVDRGWRIMERLQTTYPALAPGSYTFQVQVWNAALNLSEPATVALDVVPTVNLPLFGRVREALAIPLVGLLLVAMSGIGVSGVLISRNRRRRRQAIKRRFNPYISGEPILDSDMFYGREQILAKILNTLHENSIMIYGERRIGKTSLLHQLANQLRRAKDPEYLFVPVYVDLEGTPQEALFHVLMEEIVQVLPDYLQELPPLHFQRLAAEEYDDRAFSRDLRTLLEALKASTRKRVRLILLLDEIDVMSRYDSVVQQQMRRIFMRTFAENLGAVVAGIEISKEWDRIESPWYNLFNEIELGPIDDESARRLILEPVKGIYKFDPEAVEFIMQQSQGRPFFIQQYCLEAVNHMLAAGRSRVTLSDVQQALRAVSNARASQFTGLSSSPPA